MEVVCIYVCVCVRPRCIGMNYAVIIHGGSVGELLSDLCVCGLY